MESIFEIRTLIKRGEGERVVIGGSGEGAERWGRQIMCGGRLLEYLGWQPDMLFEFCDKETREIVYSANFPMWDH